MTSSTAPDGTREIPFGRPWIGDGERTAVDRVLRGHILTHGPECAAFEAEFARFVGEEAHCSTVSSCTTGLHLAYLGLGIGPGDEVIVPAQTHVATAHAVEWVGATPVFVDCDPATGNLTAERIEPHLGERTRAVSVVHFLGIPCAMPEIVELADAHGLHVVEDCALAVGARFDGRHVGLFGDAGCFSFYPVKHLTTAEGGMFVSRREELVAHVARLRALGVDRRHDERAIPGMYDVPMLGHNFRIFTDVLLARDLEMWKDYVDIEIVTSQLRYTGPAPSKGWHVKLVSRFDGAPYKDEREYEIIGIQNRSTFGWVLALKVVTV